VALLKVLPIEVRCSPLPAGKSLKNYFTLHIHPCQVKQKLRNMVKSSVKVTHVVDTVPSVSLQKVALVA
jgi:hypothetical protein